MQEVKKYVVILPVLCAFVVQKSVAQEVSKSLYDDPVYHGAADPVVIYNKARKCWWMFYTNRRASIQDTTVQWVHGTRIGIAESKDGVKWSKKRRIAKNSMADR